MLQKTKRQLIDKSRNIAEYITKNCNFEVDKLYRIIR